MVVELIEYKLSDKQLERKGSEQDFISKAVLGSVKQLENKVRSVQEEVNLLLKTNEEVLDSYGEDQIAVKIRIENVAESAPTRLVGMVMCIGRASLKWCTRKISERHCFGEE